MSDLTPLLDIGWGPKSAKPRHSADAMPVHAGPSTSAALAEYRRATLLARSAVLYKHRAPSFGTVRFYSYVFRGTGGRVMQYPGFCVHSDKRAAQALGGTDMSGGDCFWTGRCVSRQTQDRLLRRIDQLAEGRCAVYRAGALKGRISIGRDIFGQAGAMDADAAKVFVRRNLAYGAGPYRRSCLVEVNEVRIRGIEFRPFAPPPESWSPPPSTLVPARRASFVFVKCEQYPALDGRLVDIWDGAELAAWRGCPSDPSGWELAAPVLCTRYFLEDWAAHFLSWVKFFFIEDLVYTNVMDYGKDLRLDGLLGGYDIFRQQFEALTAKFGRDRAEAMAFRTVALEFDKACRGASAP